MQLARLAGITSFLLFLILYQNTIRELETRSPFQSQLTILQNAINNWHTLHDNFSDLHAETLLQTGVSCSNVLYVLIAKYVPFQRHFYVIKKRLIFFSMLNFGDTNSCYRRK